MALTRHAIQKIGFALLLLSLMVLSVARTVAQDFLDPEKAFVLQAQMYNLQARTGKTHTLQYYEN
jgi:hypothetical protein